MILLLNELRVLPSCSQTQHRDKEKKGHVPAGEGLRALGNLLLSI